MSLTNKSKTHTISFSEAKNAITKLNKSATTPESVINLKIPGVYFLFKDDTLVYVGQSTHVPTRIAAHVREGRLEFDKVSFIRVPPERLLEVEAYYIDLLWPEENQTGERAEIRRQIEEAELNMVGETEGFDS